MPDDRLPREIGARWLVLSGEEGRLLLKRRTPIYRAELNEYDYFVPDAAGVGPLSEPAWVLYHDCAQWTEMNFFPFLRVLFCPGCGLRLRFPKDVHTMGAMLPHFTDPKPEEAPGENSPL